MPSSQYVYADANQTSGSVSKRRSSQHFRRNIMDKTSNLDETVDPDETILEEDMDETILLSDEENVGGEEHPLKSDAMDLDQKFGVNGNQHNHHFTQASSAGIPMPIRGGAKGFLSSDPLTSSTQATASTPFTAVRATAKTNQRINTKERLRRFAESFDSDGSDEDMSEREFLQAVARKQAARQALLAESQHQPRTQQQQDQHSNNSVRQESFLQTQQHNNSFRQQNESEDTALIANHGASSSHNLNQSLSESFGDTQSWEKELNSSTTMKSTSYPQNAPQKDRRTQEYQPGQQREQTASNNLPSFPRNSTTMKSTSYPRNAPQKDRRTQEYQPGQQRKQTTSNSLSSFPQNAPQKDHRRQEHPPNHQGKQASNKTQPNHHSLSSYAQNGQQKDHRMQEHQPNQHAKQASSNTQPYHRDTSTVANPYHRKQPPPPTKMTAANVPKISLEHLKSGKKSSKSNNNRSNGSRGNASSSTDNGETWQAEAFRSSLLDLLGSFPSNYFDSSDEAIDDHESILFATSATECIDDESPHSTTSQSAASAQLQRKRLFDAASRSLARLAIASRHSTKNGDGDRSSRTSDGDSPDFEPPSPRSLPSYMSVMNVYDDSSPSGSNWGGNANAMLSTSKEVFSGQSVHGRNARTVHLSSDPQGNGNPLRRNDLSSSNPFSLWTSEQLAYGSMVLAAQVCHEASCDPNFDEKHSSSSNESESCRVAGFAHSSNQGRKKRPAVSSALVESSLGFLATAFACLESDFVYSVLKSTLKASGGIPNVSVLDALSHFAPVGGSDLSHDASTQQACTIPVLSLLALSRGLEAALYVARYATSLDPSSACAAYSSPHYSCVGGKSNCTIDTGIDEGGVGWLSSLGRDLGLKLEDNLNSRPRHMHLSEIAGYAYDFILNYNPMIVDDEADSLHGVSGRDDRSRQRRGNSRGGLYIDTQEITQGRQGVNGAVCRQPSIMNDRMYAALVEFLSSMIHTGVVSGWLSSVPASEGGDLNESNYCARTVERLCQKLFFVIETRARLRRSTNQNTATNDPGDSEAVCAASLSLLILALPKHVSQSAPSSLSTLGNSTGTIEDLLQSPLVRKMVEMALSWQDRKNDKESDNVMKYQATSNAIYVLSDICMAGGSSLISSHFRQRLDDFLENITESICKRGKLDDCFDNSSIDSSLVFLLQLHTGSPIFLRTFLRNYIMQSSTSDDDCASCFVSGLLHLSTSESFSAFSCASSLLRALIDGNPADRTQDRLSEIIMNSLDTEHVGSTIECLLRSLVETTYSYVHCNVPNLCIRWHPRLCSLGDLLGVCTPSDNMMNIFASSLSDEVLGLFVTAVESDQQNNLCMDMDTLGGSANLSLLFLFASFTNNDPGVSNDHNGETIQTQQRNVREKLLIRASGFLTVLEVAMAQGTSADMTHRALKLQNSLLSLSDERSLAFTYTKASNSVARKELTLRDKLEKSEMGLKEMASKYQHIEVDRDNLCNSFHDQRLAYERRLEWTRSESRMASRNVSEIHVHERKQAEERYNEEKELRMRTEEANEQLTRERSSDKSRIEELEKLLGQERKSRQDFESALEICKNELCTSSEELERTSNACHDLREKLSISEEKVSDLTATNEDAKVNLEDTYAKLIKLATIYQSKESEMDKYKAELRSAVNNANRHADTAIQKYESAKQLNKSLSKKLDEASKELKDIKAHRADIQRMRKNAPVAYLNQLHNDPRIKEKKHSRRNHSGKENDRR